MVLLRAPKEPAVTPLATMPKTSLCLSNRNTNSSSPDAAVGKQIQASSRVGLHHGKACTMMFLSPMLVVGDVAARASQRSSLQLRLPMLRLGPKMLACLGQTTVAEEVDIVGAFTHTLGDEISHSSSVA